MVFRSDHFSVLFCFVVFSAVASPGDGVFVWARAPSQAKVGRVACERTPLLAVAQPSAIVESAARRGVSAFPVAGVILKFEGMVTFAL
jgi:hypothetical protein